MPTPEIARSSSNPAGRTRPIRLLYLTFYEHLEQNGIYNSQVRDMLCRLGQRYRGEIEVSHIAILPGAVVGKGDLAFPFVSEKRAIAAARDTYARNGVRFSVVNLPVVVLKRWNLHPSLPILALNIALSLPILAYRTAWRRFDIVHCRSYIATILALLLKPLFPDMKVIFDPRGFYPEEGVVHGRWKEGSWTFRFWKRVERWLVRRADRVIGLSDTFVERVAAIDPHATCTLVYAGADLARFQRDDNLREQKRQELELTGKLVFVYSGGLGAWHRPDLLGRVYRVLRDGLPNTKLLVLSHANPIALGDTLLREGLREGDFHIVAAKPGDVAGYLMAGDFGLVPLRDMSSSSSAINVVADTMIGLKVAEYLAGGLPILVNSNVRGIRTLMTQHRVGIFFDTQNLAAMIPQIQELLSSYGACQAECKAVASEYLSLEESARSYSRIYKELIPGSALDLQPQQSAITR